MLKSCLKLLAGMAISTAAVTPSSYTMIQAIGRSLENVKLALEADADQAVTVVATEEEDAVSTGKETQNEEENAVASYEEAVQVTSSAVLNEAPAVIEAPVAPVAPVTEVKAEENAVSYAYEAVETKAEEAPVTEEAPKAETKMHSIDTSMIGNDLDGKYFESFLADIRSGSQRLYYNGDSAEAVASLSEVASVYCSMENGIQFYNESDASGSYLEIADEAWNEVQNAVTNADAAWAGYRTYVAEALHTLNLNASDADLVDQINTYICSTYDYAVTNSGMPQFISTGIGQCWHYSKLFADMCKAAGINAWMVENAEHAWNQVEVEGQTYTFDVTYNDTGANWTAYSWM